VGLGRETGRQVAVNAVLTPPLWVTSKGTMEAIAAVDPEVAARVFVSDHAIALGGRPGAITGTSWASCAQFEADATSGAIGADVRVAMYDPERWRQTPLEEQRDPLGAMTRFGDVARQHGYVCMIAPHPGLLSVKGSALARDADETEEAAYERSGITEAAARAADIIETQAQRLQNRPDAYRAIVSATAARASAANPSVLVLSGLSTSPGFAATPQMLLDAWSNVADVVDGHYLSLAKGRYPEAMAAFLRSVLELDR
jgi:hypothetical protein